MRVKYFRCTLQGEHSAEAALRALGDAAPQGMIVRHDLVRGETRLYIAGQAVRGAKGAARKKAPLGPGVKIEQVSEREVTK